MAPAGLRRVRPVWEERYAAAIAAAIERARAAGPVRPPAPWGDHPGRPAGNRPAGEAASAKRVSGHRIAVNDELTAISDAPAAIPG
ncbi:MAG: hypothetical protein ACLRWL_05930 [Evtepia gabavorous]